jgi:hypothetical protein
MATSPCERVKFQEGHVPPVHDLPGFYPSVEPRHARPETLGPDTACTGNRNPSFAFELIIRPCGGKVTKIFCTADGGSARGEVWARKAGGLETLHAENEKRKKIY